MNFTIGISPCPNDTFVFYAMLNKKIDTFGVNFNMKMADVEELNRLVLNSEIDISKISFHAYAYAAANYVMLRSGGALGKSNGPLLISRHKVNATEINNCKTAIPGMLTTANMLLSIAKPELHDKHEYLFSEIEKAVLTQEVELGLIIHESRFTYQQLGLQKVFDLGLWWENEFQLPLPLGGIAAKRNLGKETLDILNRIIRNSIEYAYQNSDEVLRWVKKFAQSLDENVILNHIALYVNQYSIDVGEEGIKAVNQLFGKAADLNIIKRVEQNIFV